MTLDRLKPAARAVRQLRLAAEFPNIEGLYRQRSLSRLMTKRLWPVALSYVGNDAALQVWSGAQLVQLCHVCVCVCVDWCLLIGLQARAQAVHITAVRPGNEAVTASLAGCWLTQLCACVCACLQTQLVQGMAEAGEDALAEEYRKQLGLPQDTLAPPDPGQQHTRACAVTAHISYTCVV